MQVLFFDSIIPTATQKNMIQSPKRPPRFLLAIADDIQAEIYKSAAVNNRPLTAEINLRLRESLQREKAESELRLNAYTAGAAENTPPTTRGHKVREDVREMRNTGIEDAILAVIRSLPPEKQLAFLTLFK